MIYSFIWLLREKGKKTKKEKKGYAYIVKAMSSPRGTVDLAIEVKQKKTKRKKKKPVEYFH